jgi:tetratricopeptide (TPR) repeat protein
MVAREIKLVLAIDDDAARSRLEASIIEMGLIPDVVGTSTEVYRLTPEEWSRALVILDTNDDVARLVQIVDNLHRSPYHPGGEVPVICVASLEAIEQNLSLCVWLINGRAAVFMVWARSGREFEQLPSIVQRMSQPRPAETVPAKPAYEEYLNGILSNPTDPQPFLDLADRLMEWQDQSRSTAELAVALRRQAIRLNPAAALPRAQLAGELIRLGEEEAAIAQCREAIRLQPDLAQAHLHLGTALSAKKQWAEARSELETAITLAPEGSVAFWAKHTLDRLRHAEEKHANGQG